LARRITSYLLVYTDSDSLCFSSDVGKCQDAVEKGLGPHFPTVEAFSQSDYSQIRRGHQINQTQHLCAKFPENRPTKIFLIKHKFPDEIISGQEKYSRITEVKAFRYKNSFAVSRFSLLV
jgi:hypothetical protein